MEVVFDQRRNANEDGTLSFAEQVDLNRALRKLLQTRQEQELALNNGLILELDLVKRHFERLKSQQDYEPELKTILQQQQQSQPQQLMHDHIDALPDMLANACADNNLTLVSSILANKRVQLDRVGVLGHEKTKALDCK